MVLSCSHLHYIHCSIVTAALNKLYTFVVTDEVMAELRMVTSRIAAVTFDKKFKSKEMLTL